ncbi:BREX system serine/threonine kinase PglW [Azohydromonas australica]|uniref:BREX system serine/threonine kinase PglW n=1 Tax=Azohydromonas australica TaxID=364039 RepID=UPI0004102E79|nr:BREX system serine/threonine kinase PglW [Azohydromonas australica]
MTLGAARWHVIAESNFQWEREALEWLRAQLPDRDPWHVWTNFEFIDDEGRVNEVDALVLSPAGLFLVEIKSRPGTLTGDTHTWTWRTDGRDRTTDNPLILANRKSKRLASVLRRQSAVAKAKIRLPFIEPAIFLSSTSLACRLEGLARAGVFQHGRPGAMDDDGIVGALARGVVQRPLAPVDGQQARAVARGLSEAGIRPSNKHRQVGDYRLGRLIEEGESFQDWEAQHVSIETVHRRVRIFTVATASTPEARSARVRQARREFQVLEGIDHPGILKAREYKETEQGPALVFDHDPKARRLDHLLREHGALLTLSQRLQLVRDVAEVLRYAHGKRLYHRALGPQSIVVQGIESGQLALRLMNWQTASRIAGDTTPDTPHRTTGTRHVEDYVEDPGLVYLAPEALRSETAPGPALDVFSLGALAYHVFSGQPPAASLLELQQKLRAGPGLRLSDVMDGCGSELQALVQRATDPEVLARFESVREFLDQLDQVEDELTTPDPEATVDPDAARAGDRLEGGFSVVRSLGRGASSVVLLVREDGDAEELVLKVARDAAHDDRLVAEGEVLARLRHPHIVEYRRTLTVAGRSALLLRSAGDKTLAEQLRPGRLSLDLLQRFGEELIGAVTYLEAEGVAHRDLKPENVGISSRNGRLQLVLFDFSLTRTPTENISAGTHPYLDPFLPERKPPRWDLYAERYALAVTLYEMAVGQPPAWGDNVTSPLMLDVEATIERDVFDPVVREALAAFFTQALRRDFKQRFDNAEEMLRAWRAVFDTRATAPSQARGFEAVALAATAATTMAELGYSLEAQEVLERMGVHNARELLAVPRIEFRYLKGVGDKIRKEIRLRAKDLARLRPDLAPDRGSTVLDDDEAGGDHSINALAAKLMPRRPAADDRADDAALERYLGLDDAVPALAWPAVGEAAQAAGVERAVLAGALVKARDRWLKWPALTELRAQLETLLPNQGQVMSVREVAQALLALRGCASADDAERLRLAGAVLRAALEAEAHTAQPRFEAFAQATPALVAASAAWAQYARQLGAAADDCAQADPLLPPQRVLQTLEAVSLPEGATPLPPARLLRLAASASRQAALSSRQELYPVGMSPLQALRQSMGALIGVPHLTERDLQERVRGRYPEASPLPGRPRLDALLDEAGAPLQWDPTAADGRGAWRPVLLGAGTTGGTTATLFSHQSTLPGGLPATDAVLDDARRVEERLQRSLRQGGLLALSVELRLARHAEAELLRRFAAADAGALRRLSVDALLLRELRAQATAARVDWGVVLRADAAEAGSRDRVNLLRLVQRTLPALRSALLDSPAPLLVVNCGLLARYELMPLLAELEGAAGRPGRTPAAWLLLPAHDPSRACIDDVAVPLVNAQAALSLPQAWIENRHRAGVAA